MVIQTILGSNKVLIILTEEICPPIHSIVVVTSPIGDHAPPAFAPITIMPQKNSLIFLSGTSFLVRDTIKIAVVRLSSSAERKKVTQHITHNKVFGFFVVIRSVITLNP